MTAGQPKTILAIESSCDETAAAVLLGGRILSSVIKSQINLHRQTGGVVPEVAARAHIQNILPVTRAALVKAGKNLSAIDYLAVTSGPGLIVSLIVGVEFVKGLALALDKPIIPVNHMAGHLFSAFAEQPEKVKFPVVALVVSGGHTMIFLMRSFRDYRVIGRTVDDAVGEAFDKVARLLGLPYPGGPQISKLAAQTAKASPRAALVKFPRPMKYEKSYDFSFSGLKTAVRYYLESLPQPPTQKEKALIARSFETAAIDVLVYKTLRAAKEYGAKTVSLSGGVAANAALRQTLQKASRAAGFDFRLPQPALCTDNAAMIAIAAYHQLQDGFKPVPLTKVKADPGWELA